ncbi:MULTISPECIES: collagen-like triple helix repeat-containing protein [Bacillus subtilis group]|uniref:collagen-like triple helix repeat-containing protein n=1 Tax=Bacillus subtilis group TaxID=653685 RepID=UPI001381BE6E|nr:MULTISPECIES: collagen-like protein [Bacillus subtilis group]TWK68731.1 hypothetical protein CHCC20339_0697 [Bacillus licheniformis]TWM16763.1 hypothetical protein CHCC15087_1042 [Bacillus licheniformis]WKU32891.1 collagen-like protein [Bacillus licheniformis]GIN34025.1 hypothetical protein J5TS1_15280 [Bacillus licheniformis]
MTGPTGATGATGAIGVTGPTGPTGPQNELFFTNTSGPIPVYSPPTVPLNTEVIVATVANVPVTSGQDILINYALALETVATANNNVIFQVRLYRDGTLLQTRIFNRNAQLAGTQRFPLSDTYVDTVPATTTLTYTVRIAVTTASSITSATAFNRNLNLTRYP